MSVHIRPARLDDLGPITEIYNHYVVRTAITFDIDPVPVEDRHAWFLEHTTGAGHRLLVAEDGGRIVGYAGTGTFRGKRGLGTRLYTALFEALVGEPVHRAVAGVTLPNPASLALHARFGFREVGVFRENGRKLDRYWDVMWLERAL